MSNPFTTDEEEARFIQKMKCKEKGCTCFECWMDHKHKTDCECAICYQELKYNHSLKKEPNIMNNQIKKIINEIWSDISGRAGVGNELDQIDEETKLQIMETWKYIIKNNVNSIDGFIVQKCKECKKSIKDHEGAYGLDGDDDCKYCYKCSEKIGSLKS